jgi:hypothetical protein
MDYSKTYARLWEFVREIYQYYAANNHLVNDQLVISKSMVHYIFPELSETDINALYHFLVQDSYVTYADQDTLTFSDAFYRYNFRSPSPGSDLEH